MGAWIEIIKIYDPSTGVYVAPLVGAWIEICRENSVFQKRIPVAPLVGAWIEIHNQIQQLPAASVAPLVGAWIEIVHNVGSAPGYQSSLPSWERGLK